MNDGKRARYRSALVVITAVVICGLARTSFAATSSYNGTGCWLDSNGSDGTITRSNGGVIAGPGGAKVTCPVPKVTSGPSVTSGDEITSVQVALSSGASALVTCDLIVYDAAFSAGNTGSGTNILEDHSVTASVSGQTSLSINTKTRANFWNPSSGGWLVAELHCVLPAGVDLKSYTVIENGTDLGGRILPMTGCTADPAFTSGWQLKPEGLENDGAPPNANVVAGYIESEQLSSDDLFAIDCPVVGPGERTVELSIGPSLSDDVTCDDDVVTAPLNDTGGFEFATANPPPQITALGTFTCSTTGSGDAKFVSYRVGPTTKINCGGATAAPYAADELSSGGRDSTPTTHAIDVTGLEFPAPQAVYQHGRVGNFTYTIPGFGANQTYHIRLHFAETYWQRDNQRTFNVTINGFEVLEDFDIIANANGAEYKAVIMDFFVAADTAGRYVIQFSSGPGTKDQPLVSGIEIL